MKKTISFILLCTLIISLTSCIIKAPKHEEDTTIKKTLETPENTTEEVQTKKPSTVSSENKKVAEKFVKAILDKNYSEAISYFNIESSRFFTAEDFEWYLPRSAYSDLADITWENFTVSSDTETDVGKEAGTAIVTITNADNEEETKSIDVGIKLNNDNKWVLSDESFYIKNYYIVTPGGNTVLTINGEVVGDGLKIGTFGGMKLRAAYCIPAIGKSKKDFVIKADSFGEISKQIMPTGNSSESPEMLVATNVGEDVYEGICNLCNNIWRDVENGKEAADIMQYLSPSANPEYASVIITGIKSCLNSGTSKQYNFVFSNFRPCVSDAYVSEYLTDKIITAKFNYSANWTNSCAGYITAEDMTYYAALLLYKTGNQMTIQLIPDGSGLFTWINPFSNDTK